MGEVVKILVADDLDVNRYLLARILQTKGYTAIVAEDGHQALEIARRERPALILMDLRMPGIDGYEATRQLKADESTKAIPVIALTAYTIKEKQDKLREAGFDGHLHKPFDLEEFQALLNRWVPKSLQPD